MKKQLIAVAVVAVLALGVGVYFMTRGDDDSNGNSSGQSSNSQTGGGFDALGTSGSSFVATITTNGNNTESVSSMEYDKNSGAVKYSVNSGGQNLVMIYTSDAYYMCQTETSCYKYALNQTNTIGFDRSSYEYSDEELTALKNTSVDQGTKDCPAGSCQVWKVSSDGYESIVYVDTKTKRISQVESNTATGSSTTVYEYKDVSVTAPANAQVLPSALN